MSLGGRKWKILLPANVSDNLLVLVALQRTLSESFQTGVFHDAASQQDGTAGQLSREAQQAAHL